jgi:hypothetical protein
MKIYARQKTRKVAYGKAILGTTLDQYMKQIVWKQKGLIENITHEYAKYIEIKKELKAKGLI